MVQSSSRTFGQASRPGLAEVGRFWFMPVLHLSEAGACQEAPAPRKKNSLHQKRYDYMCDRFVYVCNRFCTDAVSFSL